MIEREDVIAYRDSGAGEQPAWLQERLEWFQDQKFGLILHWGPYAQWDCCESWPLSPGDEWARNDNMKCWTSRGKDMSVFQRDYWALNRTFNPSAYDPSVWADLALQAGIRYVALTTKHHDGFCMWDTATTDYKITGPESPYKVDVYKKLCDAFQSRGMAISTYFSKADWHTPLYWAPEKPVVSRQANTSDDPAVWSKFVEFTHNQIRELMTGYGKIDVLWLDAGWVHKGQGEDIDMDGMVSMARSLQPGLIVANRTVGDAYEDFITPEHEIPTEPLSRPWESCLCMATSWKYEENDVFKPVEEILRMLIDIVSKGGNFLIGVGPTPSGEFPPTAVSRLREIGAWMAINSEAIHGTRAIAPYGEGNVRFTRKGNRVYAFVMEGSTVNLRSLKPPIGGEIRLLGGTGRVLAVGRMDEIHVTFDAKDLPYPPVLTFELAASP